jgi:hypothetical protein
MLREKRPEELPLIIDIPSLLFLPNLGDLVPLSPMTGVDVVPLLLGLTLVLLSDSAPPAVAPFFYPNLLALNIIY